jgi:hypothetical protein
MTKNICREFVFDSVSQLLVSLRLSDSESAMNDCKRWNMFAVQAGKKPKVGTIRANSGQVEHRDEPNSILSTLKTLYR